MYLPVKKQLPLLEEKWKEMHPFLLQYWAAALSELLDQADDNSNPDQLKAHRLAVELMPQVCHVLDGLADEGEERSDDLLMLLGSARNHFMYYLTSGDTLKHLVGHSSQDICGLAYMYLGDVLRFQGELSGAREALEQAEVQYEKAGNSRGLANALVSKAELLRSMKDYDGAAATLDRAEKLYSDGGNDLGLANILFIRSEVLRCQNKYKDAENACMEAEAKYRELNASLGLANVLKSRGFILFDQGEYEKALKPLEEAYDIYRELLLVDNQAQCQCIRYVCLMQTDRVGEAEAIRPQLEALLPDLPLPVQRLVRHTLSYPTGTP
jgi:tetratricopeptide (TPR) repeat protein